MRIKKLELTGFKSFKDPTVIHFDSGITGVVGPNGCGKSNIVDALVWVMGEMSARHLRGSSMEDVIFSGADGYAPMGLCEVSLVLENDGGPFPVNYLNHSEIMITRRLHRSGESEYLINKQTARLRDIQEIFMDTGVGARGFSIVEQGAISQLITAKPEERRVFIEEAAGITKFRNRKRESQRKLKSTESNLLRLEDIIRELKRQMDSLQRQSQRAERYRKLKAELEDIELWVSSKIFLELKEKTSGAKKDFDQARDRQVGLESRVNGLQARLADLRTKTLSTEKLIEDLRNSIKEDQEEIHHKETEIREMGFQVEQARRSEEVTHSRLTENQAREKTLTQSLGELTEQLAQIRGQSEDLGRQYEDQKQLCEQKQNIINETETLLEKKRGELSSLEESRGEARTLEGRLEQSLTHLDNEVIQARNSLCQWEDKKEQSARKYKKALKLFQKERQIQLDLSEDMDSLKARKENLNREIEIKKTEYGDYKNKLGRVTSRLYGLENLRDNFEGFQEGVRSIMLRQKEDLKNLDEEQRGSHKKFIPVSDIVKVPENYEVALEAVLGPKLQMLVSRDREEALEALGYLKERKSGRSSFYSESAGLQTHEFSETDQVKNCTKALLMDVIQFDKAYSPLIEKLIQKVAVVENISQALSFRSRFPSWSFVTLEGDLFTSDGVISGGYQGDVSTGVFQREREIEELRKKEREWSGKSALIRASLKKLENQIIQINENLERVHLDRTNKEILISGLKKDLQTAEAERSLTEKSLEEQDQKLDEILKKQQKTKEELSAVVVSLRQMVDRKNGLENSIKEQIEFLEKEKSCLSDLQSTANHLQVENVRKSQEVMSLHREQQRVEKSLEETKEQMGQMDEESLKNTRFMTDTQVLIKEKQVKLEILIESLRERQKELGSLKDHYEKTNSQWLGLQEELSENITEKNKQESLMNQSQLVLEQSRMNEENLVEKIQERYQKDISRLAESLGTEDRDRAGCEEQMSLLKEKIDRMGSVNLSAIGEYDELSRRYEFLNQQVDDLINSKSQLIKVIEKINRICSKRFRETFSAVNDRFEKVFPMLFGGGQARLILIEDSEREDMGVDIVSKPPGKKLQNVSLLSGGEKALTAVSLIFSVFLVKPSPYCLLDEVDAPLDDANVVRFNDLVKEMSKHSQVILVTHNKITMEVAEKLYGVTMEEKGISKMVSVDLGLES